MMRDPAKGKEKKNGTRGSPGSNGARRAAGRGRRGPPAARRPSRSRGTASSTLQQQQQQTSDQSANRSNAPTHWAVIWIAPRSSPPRPQIWVRRGRTRPKPEPHARARAPNPNQTHTHTHIERETHLPRRDRRPSSRRAAAPWRPLVGRATGRAHGGEWGHRRRRRGRRRAYESGEKEASGMDDDDGWI